MIIDRILIIVLELCAFALIINGAIELIKSYTESSDDTARAFHLDEFERESKAAIALIIIGKIYEALKGSQRFEYEGIMCVALIAAYAVYKAIEFRRWKVLKTNAEMIEAKYYEDIVSKG